MSNNVQEINAKILQITSVSDLRIVQNALNFQFRTLEKNLKKEFQVGMKVEFNSSRPGRGKMTGVILKIMQKNIKVRCGAETWRVSPNLLKAA